MTKEQFLLELEHIAESGSNEIRLGELYDKIFPVKENSAMSETEGSDIRGYHEEEAQVVGPVSEKMYTQKDLDLAVKKGRFKTLLMLESACGRMKTLVGGDWVEIDQVRESLSFELGILSATRKHNPVSEKQGETLAFDFVNALDLIDRMYHYMKYNPPDRTKMSYNEWTSCIEEAEHLRSEGKLRNTNKPVNTNERD